MRVASRRFIATVWLAALSGGAVAASDAPPRAHAYEVVNLVNERPAEDGWRLNTPMVPAQFSPQAAAQAGC